MIKPTDRLAFHHVVLEETECPLGGNPSGSDNCLVFLGWTGNLLRYSDLSQGIVPLSLIITIKTLIELTVEDKKNNFDHWGTTNYIFFLQIWKNIAWKIFTIYSQNCKYISVI